MRYFLVLSIAVLLSLTPFGATAQQVEVLTDKPPLQCALLISAEFNGRGIVELDLLLRSFQEKRCRIILVALDSAGGDVVAAMEVGRILRRARVITIVPERDSCASACVFAFLGGVNRMPFGKIGLHRAYAASPSDSIKEAQTKRDEIDRLIVVYLKEMNIPLRLLDEMNAVSPGSVRWLYSGADKEELRQLHIAGDDAVNEDEEDSRHAKRLGISMREYYTRMQKVEGLCHYSGSDDKEEQSQYYKCHRDVMEGKR